MWWVIRIRTRKGKRLLLTKLVTTTSIADVVTEKLYTVSNMKDASHWSFPPIEIARKHREDKNIAEIAISRLKMGTKQYVETWNWKRK